MYKIGSFNCLNFGMTSSKDVQIFADIITHEKFDIIALQEIIGQNALNRILARLPSYWTGVADNTNVNDYAFIWNTRRFTLANTSEAGLSRVYEPRIYKQYRIDRKNGQMNLVREPFFARFFPVGGAAPYIEIRLINAHIRFSKGVNSDNDSLSAIAMRKNEFDVLTKAIYAKEADKRYGNNRPAYTILLGDYNLNNPSSSAKSPYLLESFTIADGNNVKSITTIQSELSTLKSSTQSDTESMEYFANNYDHFTYDKNRFSDVIISGRRINTIEKFFDGDYEKHKQNVSDHVPVILDLKIRR